MRERWRSREIYSVLYFEVAGKTEVFWSRNSSWVYAKGFSSHPVSLPLFPGILVYVWHNVGQCSHAQEAEARPSDSYFPKMWVLSVQYIPFGDILKHKEDHFHIEVLTQTCRPRWDAGSQEEFGTFCFVWLWRDLRTLYHAFILVFCPRAVFTRVWLAHLVCVWALIAHSSQLHTLPQWGTVKRTIKHKIWKPSSMCVLFFRFSLLSIPFILFLLTSTIT